MVNSSYTYMVVWSEPDQGFVATVSEFPSLSWIADTYEEALMGIQQLVFEVLLDMASEQEESK